MWDFWIFQHLIHKLLQMIKKPYIKWLLLLQVLLLLSGCATQQEELIDPAIHQENFTLIAEGTSFEDFETVSKTSYDGASVLFADGSWYFDDALVGTLSNDRKNGARSVRLRNSGGITMEFDLLEGAKSLSLDYGKFGRDKTSTIGVYYSTDAGNSWAQAGSDITVNKTSLKTATFDLDITGNVRFQIRKTDGSSNRVNIDDILIQSNPDAAPVATGEISESFDGGSKGSYASGIATVSSGDWLLNDALLGSLDNDRKTGLKSVRIRDFGSLEMLFDVQGAESISFNHAVYGSDGSSDWALQSSIDGGINWTNVGAQGTSTSINLENIVFPVSFSGNVRFRIVKLTGSGDRINIDDFVISGTTVDEGTGGNPGGNPGDSGAVHLTMGNPSNAVIDVTQENNYLLEKEEYVMSYNRGNATANWVSWHLDEAWFGDAPRQNDFRADTSLPAGWFQVSHSDYTNSGFDRGHVCPSADRTLSVDDNSNTFFMTNMMPQAPNNNRIAWANLENYCRSMLSGGYEIYIISGGYGSGGDGSNGYATTIANGQINVPSNTWKVIMILPDGENDVDRVTTNTRVIAVDMPNSQNVVSDWTQYKTSVDDLEALTGYDFFDLVPDAIENVIEASVDAI